MPASSFIGNFLPRFLLILDSISLYIPLIVFMSFFSKPPLEPFEKYSNLSFKYLLSCLNDKYETLTNSCKYDSQNREATLLFDWKIYFVPEILQWGIWVYYYLSSCSWGNFFALNGNCPRILSESFMNYSFPVDIVI